MLAVINEEPQQDAPKIHHPPKVPTMHRKVSAPSTLPKLCSGSCPFPSSLVLNPHPCLHFLHMLPNASSLFQPRPLQPSLRFAKQSEGNLLSLKGVLILIKSIDTYIHIYIYLYKRMTNTIMFLSYCCHERNRRCWSIQPIFHGHTHREARTALYKSKH